MQTCECGAKDGEDCKYSEIYPDDQDVKCNFCGYVGEIQKGCDICPECRKQGFLEWGDD